MISEGELPSASLGESGIDEPRTSLAALPCPAQHSDPFLHSQLGCRKLVTMQPYL